MLKQGRRRGSQSRGTCRRRKKEKNQSYISRPLDPMQPTALPNHPSFHKNKTPSHTWLVTK